MKTTFLNWLDDRTGYRALVHEALNEPIPGGARYRYVPGSVLTFIFMVQVITGFFLWSAYSPSTLTAWESVYYIQNVMQFGWLIRGIHAFSAQAMVVLMAVHFVQVIVDKAYKAPREVNFWLGLVLMQIVLGLALTGYLLPWDQKGYYATQVATKIAGATPFIGAQIQELIQGGPSYGHHTLTRFFALHAGVLPTLLVIFLALHVYVFRRHGITTPNPTAPPATFWPEQVMKDAVACLVVFALVLSFVLIKGAELSAPADPSEDYPARPEWYFLFLFRFLKFEFIEQYGLAFGAIYLPGLAMAIIALMPIIGRNRAGHAFNLVFTAALLAGAGALTAAAMIEDQKDPEFQAKFKFAERDAHRVVELAEREGIPPLGARDLMANDPYTQGPRLFARHCASCHRYHGHDGTFLLKVRNVTHEGHPVYENGVKKTEPEPATASDLGNFGSREWLQSVLIDYHKTFQPVADAVQAIESDWKPEQKAEVEKTNDLKKRFLTGDMAEWSKGNKSKLLEPENAESYKALVEFVVAQSGRNDLGQFDESLVKQGREVFDSGVLKSGNIDSCKDCHGMKARGEEQALSENNTGMPTLTGYGGKEWLTAFLQNPGHDDFYGQNNVMPGFETTMSEDELALLVNWMVGDYYQPEVNGHHNK